MRARIGTMRIGIGLVVALLASGAALLAAPTPASAAVHLSITPTNPTEPVTLGDYHTIDFTFRNVSSSPVDTVSLASYSLDQCWAFPCGGTYVASSLRGSASSYGIAGACTGARYRLASTTGITHPAFSTTELSPMAPAGSPDDFCVIRVVYLIAGALDDVDPAPGVQNTIELRAGGFRADAVVTIAAESPRPARLVVASSRPALIGDDQPGFADVSGLRTAAGTLTGTWYGPDDPTCSGPPFTSGTISPPAAPTDHELYAFFNHSVGPVRSIDAPGTYRFVARYHDTAGDDPDLASTCGDPRATEVAGPQTANQTISWPTQGPYPFTAGGADLRATAPGGPVTYGVVDGPCFVTGSHVTFTGGGNCILRADQPGDAVTRPAQTVVQVIAITTTGTHITWGDPADITYGTPLSATQLNATADVPGPLTYTPAAGTVLAAGAGQPLAVDLPSVANGFAAAAAFSTPGTHRTVRLTVLPKPAVITAPSATIVAGTPVPSFAPTYSGLLGVSTPATPAVCQTAASTNPAPGTYRVFCYGARDPNHEFSYVDGTLRVDPVTVPTTLRAQRVLQTLLLPTATLTRTSDGKPIPGQRITFVSAGRPLCTATTGANGVARCSFPNRILDALLRGFTASFAGAPGFGPSTATTR